MGDVSHVYMAVTYDVVGLWDIQFAPFAPRVRGTSYTQCDTQHNARFTSLTYAASESGSRGCYTSHLTSALFDHVATPTSHTHRPLDQTTVLPLRC